MTTPSSCFPALRKLTIAVALALGSPFAGAANFDVTVAADNGSGDTPGTLSKAILDANNAAGDDTITLTTDVTIQGVMKNLINSNITLQSDGTTHTISGGGSYRPLFIKSGTVTIKDLNLSNGRAQGGTSGFGGTGAGLGGALFVYDGNVTVENVGFSNNVAAGGSTAGGYGGGGMFGNGYGFGGGGLFGSGGYGPGGPCYCLHN
jgi:hypothetical protein